MDRFFDILRELMEAEFSIGGNFANKERVLSAFDKAFARAIVKYAREKGIELG